MIHRQKPGLPTTMSSSEKKAQQFHPWSGFLSCLVLSVSILACAIHFYRTGLVDYGGRVISAADLGSSKLNLLTPFAMVVLRAIMGSVVWGTMLYLLVDTEGLHITVAVRGQMFPLHLRHLRRFTVFTVWCWSLQGAYFLLALASSLTLAYPSLAPLVAPSEQVRMIAHMLFEVSFAMAFLVTFVVTFLLIPASVKQNISPVTFYKKLPLLFHNFNVVFMVIELFTNKVPFLLWHFPAAIFFGMSYIFFAWCWFNTTGVFYYFFMDYARPYAVGWYSGLVFIMSTFFLLGYVMSYALAETNHWLAYLSVLVFSVAIMDFNKYNKDLDKYDSNKAS